MTAVQSKIGTALKTFSESGTDLILQDNNLQTITFNEIATNLIQRGFENSLETYGHCYVNLTFAPNPISGILSIKKTSALLFDIESNYIPISDSTRSKIVRIFIETFGLNAKDISIYEEPNPSYSDIFQPKQKTVSFHIDLRADHTLKSKL